MTDAPTPAAPTPEQLAAMLAVGNFTFQQMAQAMLEVPTSVAGWSAAAVEKAAYLRSHGAQIGVEIFADETGVARVSLVAASPNEHIVIQIVPENSPARAN